MLNVTFRKQNSPTTYQLTCSDHESIDTVLTQFKLSLPLKDTVKNINIIKFNNVELKSDESYSFDIFNQLIHEAFDFIATHPLLKTNSNCIFVINKQLSVRKAKNRFDNTYVEYPLKSGFLYILDKPNEADTSINKSSNESTIRNIKTATDYTDFKSLQKYALELENKYKHEQNSFRIFKNLAKKTLAENINLIKKGENTKVYEPILKNNYSNYLKTNNDKLNFIQNLLISKNTSIVQQLTHNSDKQLLTLIKEVCDYK